MTELHTMGHFGALIATKTRHENLNLALTGHRDTKPNQMYSVKFR